MTRSRQSETPGLVAELLGAGYEVRLRVTGRSMLPFLADGSVVTLRGVDPDALRLGDIALCRPGNGSLVLHRIVSRPGAHRGSWTVITKGDALLAPDPPTAGEQVLGRVVAVHAPRRRRAPRDIHIGSPLRRPWQRLLAAASLTAPRTFFAISRRIVPLLPLL